MANKKKKKTVKASPVSPKKKAAPKKKMAPETKAMIKTSFATLVNNDACIKTSREYKGIFWNVLAIGIGLVSMVIADVPNLVSRINVDYGSALLGGACYGYDTGLVNFSKALSDKSVTLTIENGTPKVENWEEMEFVYDGEGHKRTWYSDISTSQDEAMFEAFVNSSTILGVDVDDDTFFSRIEEGKMPENGSTRPGYAEKAYTVNYIAFGKATIKFGRYDANGQGSSIPASNADLEGTNFAGIIKEKTTESGGELVGKELRDFIVGRYQGIVSQGTKRARDISAWSYTGIIAAVYIGLEIIFGFVLFLLTRGKRNPFRIYTFWETQKMAYWASFAPAVLSLAIGFMIPNFAMMAFIFLFGMRLMWMSMKNMRPAA